MATSLYLGAHACVLTSTLGYNYSYKQFTSPTRHLLIYININCKPKTTLLMKWIKLINSIIVFTCMVKCQIDVATFQT